MTVRARPEAENGYAATAMLIGEDLALTDTAPSRGRTAGRGRPGSAVGWTSRPAGRRCCSLRKAMPEP
ncbi:MAG: hypothetical protein HPM95_12385 [Alphaproteobacteria bacterium]|nr:hypothetical protein [Alphaproteobacteria bacterium]